MVQGEHSHIYPIFVCQFPSLGLPSRQSSVNAVAKRDGGRHKKIDNKYD